MRVEEDLVVFQRREQLIKELDILSSHSFLFQCACKVTPRATKYPNFSASFCRASVCFLRTWTVERPARPLHTLYICMRARTAGTARSVRRARSGEEGAVRRNFPQFHRQAETRQDRLHICIRRGRRHGLRRDKGLRRRPRAAREP